MALFTEWVTAIQRTIPEPLESLIQRYVHDSVQEFLRESEAWQVEISVPLQSGVYSYDLSTFGIPADTFIGACPSVVIDIGGNRAIPLRGTDLRNTANPKSQATCYAMSGAGKLTLDGDATGTLKCIVILYAGRNLAEVPDTLADRFFNVINYGALARLLRVPAKVWTDVGTAEHYEALFREGIQRSKREARQERSRPIRQVRFSPDY